MVLERDARLSPRRAAVRAADHRALDRSDDRCEAARPAVVPADDRHRVADTVVGHPRPADGHREAGTAAGHPHLAGDLRVAGTGADRTDPSPAVDRVAACTVDRDEE